MKCLEAISAALQGAVQGFKQGLSLHSKNLKAFHEMEVAHRKSFHATTALLEDLESRARMARDIRGDFDRRIEP